MPPVDPTISATIKPLPNTQPIVDRAGNPNLYFIRFIQEISQLVAGGISYEQLLEVLGEIQIHAGVGLDGGGPINNDVTINLADTTVVPDTYGDATHVARITVNQQGQITHAELVAITAGSSLDVDENGATIVAGATKLNFTGTNVHVTEPVAGEADVAVDAYNLEIDDSGGVVVAHAVKLKFVGATVTDLGGGEAEIDIAAPSAAIYAPVVTGALPGPVPIAGPRGQFIMARIR